MAPLFRSLVLAAALFVLASGPASAQDKSAVPTMPPPLQALAAEGAQIRYLGREHGLDGWITIQKGQEQYFYVTPDGEAMLMGLLFDKSGKLVTVEQIKALRGSEEGDVLDMLTGDRTGLEKDLATQNPDKGFKSPAERMYADVEGTNWIRLGDEKAPYIYVFVDPQCPHCHDFLTDLKAGIEGKKIQVRLIPIGFREETVAQAALLLAAPNPQELWFRHLAGDKDALPARQGVNEQGVQMNLAVMQSWKFDVTPVTVYRDKDGKVKLVRGRASDLDALYADLR